MVRRPFLPPLAPAGVVFLGRRVGRLAGMVEKSGTVAGGGDAGGDASCFVVGAAEGAGVAGEDVTRGGFGESDGVARGGAGGEGEDVVIGVNGTGRDAPFRGAGIDVERVFAIDGPDGVDVGFEVSGEEGGVDGGRFGWADDAEAVRVPQLVPRLPVGLGLGFEFLLDPVEAVGGDAGDVLGLGAAFLRDEGEGDGDGDEVDVGDVAEELVVVVGELAEIPFDVDVGVLRVVDVRLDEGGALVQ